VTRQQSSLGVRTGLHSQPAQQVDGHHHFSGIDGKVSRRYWKCLAAVTAFCLRHLLFSSNDIRFTSIFERVEPYCLAIVYMTSGHACQLLKK